MKLKPAEIKPGDVLLYGWKQIPRIVAEVVHVGGNGHYGHKAWAIYFVPAEGDAGMANPMPASTAEKFSIGVK